MSAEADGRTARGSSPSRTLDRIMNTEMEFLVAVAQTASAEARSHQEPLKLTPEDQRVFVDALLNPRAPAKTLKGAATCYRAAQGR